jgi:hypothetical protein
MQSRRPHQIAGAASSLARGIAGVLEAARHGDGGVDLDIRCGHGALPLVASFTVIHV